MQAKNYRLRLVTAYFFIKVFGTLFALYIFNRYSPLIDSMAYIRGEFLNDDNIRTQIIQYITSFLVSLTNPLTTHIFFSLFSGLAILYYSLKSKESSYLLLILLLPSSLVWTSIVSKESLYFGIVGIFLMIWINLINNKLNFQPYFLSLLIVISMSLRPHYSLSLIWLTFTAIMTKKTKNYWLIIFSFTLLIIIICWWLMPNLVDRGYTAIDHSARASRFIASNISSMVDFKQHLFSEALFGIIGPFPRELFSRPEFLPFFIEGWTILIAPLAIGLKLITNLQSNIKNNIYFLNWIYGVIPATIILILVHSPFGILNPGSAIRWRVNFELIFYLAPLLLFLEAKKNDH